MSHSGFFQRQANARRNTALLVFLFLLAVTLITLAVCLVGYFVTRSETSSLAFQNWLLSGHGLYTALAVIVVIGGGSLARWVDLAGGGHRVASMVNARALDPSTQDAEERRLRNIVEEMAIASGITVPDLYVMDNETGINAFVAGYTPGEAVMVVTHGALTHLSRDELQGVVAHEFSHILNGDMRLNVRLIAILAGILMIGQIGTFLVRVGFVGSRGRSSRSSRGQGALGFVGVALLVIGYIGVFFGRLIQSAVSRQREMLADASSVQFTRNPEGIAGALFKIGIQTGYLDTTSHASDMNHMCFSESARMKLSSLLASHPPVAERIEAIAPGMMARLRSRHRDTLTAASLRAVDTAGTAEQIRPEATAGFSGVAGQTGKHEPISTIVGTGNRASEDYAQALLTQLPSTFRNLLYTRAGAIQLCYGLLIHERSEQDRKKHLAQLPDSESLFAPNPGLLEKLLPPLAVIGPGVRVPALELAMPALRKLDPQERDQLLASCETLIKADRQLSLFELTMISFLRKHLAEDAGRASAVRYRDYRSVQPYLRVLFSLLARLGAATPDRQQALLEEAMAGFQNGNQRDRKPLELSDRISHKQLRESLMHLNGLSPLLKPGIIDASCHCILSDGAIRTSEYELIRLIADQLDCPMPPLVV